MPYERHNNRMNHLVTSKIASGIPDIHMCDLVAELSEDAEQCWRDECCKTSEEYEGSLGTLIRITMHVYR